METETHVCINIYCIIFYCIIVNKELVYFTGWIGILSEWLNHEDIRVSIPAARALANMDVDNHAVFSRHLFLLHPVTRTTKDHELDVIFIHGLLGGVFYTWRQRNTALNTLSIIGKKKKKGMDFLHAFACLKKFCLIL